MNAPAVQYVTTSDGVSIAYSVAGEGRPLVLGPGPLNHLGWIWRRPLTRAILERLTSHFRLVQYDGRGQGLSMRGLKDNLRLEDWLLDLEAVVEAAGLERFVLVHGGSPAFSSVLYSVKNPERVEALILENIPLARRSTVPASLDAMAQENWELFLEATGRTSFPYEPSSVSKEMVRETWNPLDWSLKARAWQGRSIEDVLRQLRVPTLLLATGTGVHGFAVREEDIRIIAALIPDSRLMVLDPDEGGVYLVGADGTAAGPDLIAEFLDGIEARHGNQLPPPSRVADRLSPRETEVLHLLAAGRSNQQIADELVISLNTVNRHVSNIYAKTGAANRAEAASYATRRGLV
jgi:DNA-binding CsgD family transcriptional regulator/pimeloyl-ACP methyl ester carboxylesterase